MSNNTKAWTDLAAALVSRSEMFEESAPSGAQAIQQLMSSLGEVTAQSFVKPEPEKSTFVKSPLQRSAVSRPLPTRPESKAFSASKKEYQPALQDRTLASALEKLQAMRQKNQTTNPPKIVTSQFRQAEFPAAKRVHAPSSMSRTNLAYPTRPKK
jgi:hypothetical protein